MKQIFIVFFLAAAVAGVSSCSLRIASSTAKPVNSSLNSYTQADLEISGQKISYTYVPNKRDRKEGMKHCLSNATAAALKENGNADVLVERQYQAIVKYRFFGLIRRIKSVTVSGYPGTYRNFRQVEQVTSGE